MEKEIVVLRACAGGTDLFEFFRDPALQGRLAVRDLTTGQRVSTPSDALLGRVTRVLLHEQPATSDFHVGENDELFCFPIIPRGPIAPEVEEEGTLLRLRNSSSGPVLDMRLVVRCFLKSGNTRRRETARFDCSIEIPAAASGVYRRAVIARGAYWFNWTAEWRKSTAIPLERTGFAREFAWQNDAPNGAGRIAPDLLGVSLNQVRESKLRIEAVATTTDPDARRKTPLTLQFRLLLKSSLATDINVKLNRFPGVEFRADALQIRQRPSHPLALGTSGGIAHWLVEVQLSKETWHEFLNRFNAEVSQPVHGALRLVRDGQPLSLVPRLEPLKLHSPPSWWAVHSITGEWDKLLLGEDGYPRQLDFDPAGGTDFDGGVKPFHLLGRALEPDEQPADAGERRGHLVMATFPAFRTTNAATNATESVPLRLPLLLHRIDAPHSETPTEQDQRDAPEYRLGISEIAGEDGLSQRVRLGALELVFGSQSADIDTAPIPVAERTGSLRLQFAKSDPGTSLPAYRPQIRELKLNLSIHALEPAAQDPLPGDEFAELFQDTASGTDARPYEQFFYREPPLVLAVRSDAAKLAAEPRLTASSPFILDAHETILTAETQTLDLRLSRSQAEIGGPVPGEEQRLWIIDRDPLLIAEVRVRDFLSDLIAGATNEIANFSTRSGAAWEITAGAQGFDLVLPPQGIGEAMEKNKAFDGGRPDDVSENAVISYRFTPPAILRVQPAYYRQRFAEPPWNLRRLLGYPGQRDPGMAVERIDFELFYGLAGRVERDDLRLAEIAARLGALPGRQPVRPLWRASQAQELVFSRHRRQWARWYAQLLGRLAILEPWRHGQGDRELALTEGVSFALRHSARMRFPVPLPAGVEGQLDIPNRTYADESQLTPEEKAESPGAPLPGGVAWPFESLNLYNLLWRKPNADAAELHRPFFSALGGWGFQKATFAQGQLRIYADTAMGRTHSVTLEVLGRISVGWHLAKLVIVYERSVLPTRQFVNEVFAEQDTLRGRPVLRKVKEYVEILEPVRRFPDGVSAAVESGCLTAIEFPEGARRINVTSRWGQDVGLPNTAPELAEGWKVPLWMRGAQPEDVYPKPQVLAVFAPAQGEAPVSVEIDSPEKFYFFTSTKDKRSPDPHLWPAVQGIDYGWSPPKASRPPDPPNAWLRGNPEAVPDPDREDPAVKGGLGPFTFTLKQPSHAINVLAARNAQPIGAMLRNVTVMRGLTPTKVAFHEEETKLIALRDHVDAGVASAREWIGLTREVLSRDSGARGAAKELLGQIDKEMAKIREKIVPSAPQVPLPEPSELCARLHTQVRRSISPARARAQGLGRYFTGQAQSVVDKAGADLASAKQALRKARADFEKRFRQELQELAPVLGALDDADRLLDEIDDVARAALGWFGEFLLALEALPTPWLAAAAAWEDATDSWRYARDLIREAQGGIDLALSTAARPWTGPLPDAFRVELRITATGPWSKIEAAIRALAASTAFAAMENAFEDGNQRTYEQARNELIATVRPARDALAEAWTELHTFIKGKLDLVRGYGENLRNGLSEGAEKAWQEFAMQLDSLDQLADLEAFQSQLRSTLQGIDQQWDGALQRAEDTAMTAIDPATCEAFFASTKDYLDYLNQVLAPGRLTDWIEETLNQLPTSAEVQRQLQVLERELAEAARGLLERAAAESGAVLERLAEPVASAGDSVLRLVRAFGEAPRVPSLDFRLPDASGITDRLADIGYYFQDLVGKVPLPHVDLTPVLARTNQLGKDLLNPLEIKLPTTQLFDRFRPTDLLGNFDLRRVFPNFAGLQLDDLFEGLKLPEGARDRIKITHGADPQSFRGWVQIEVDQPFSQPATVFTFAGLVMQVRDGRFKAVSRIEGGAGQPPRQNFQGEITGDWGVTVGGFALITIERTALRFDDSGRITYDVRPDKVKLPGPMAFLADAVSKFNYADKGFSFKVDASGVQVVLDLPLPDVQAGAFGLANLRLGFFFELSVLGEFVITGGANIATRQAPFTLTVFILGGAGWFDFRYRYAPASRELVATVSIGIMASASLAISLGPISGGVYAYFGIVVEYSARRDQGGHLAVALVLRFVGQVSLLGIVTAYLEIGLEAQYSSGGGLVGRGYIRVKIKICWCFTLSIACSVSYTFGGSSGGSYQVESAIAPSPGIAPGALAVGALDAITPVSETAGVPPTYAQVAAAYTDMFA